MKVYFTASVTGKKYNLENYKSIVNLLKKNKCNVISDHILKSTAHAIHSGSKKDRLIFQKKLDNWLKKCDFVVAETSFPSISVGYEISLAVSMQKAVLLLYNSKRPPSLLADHKSDNFVCEKYSTGNVEEVIKGFINYVKGATNSRFTFFITPKIAGFLDQVSRKKKVPKSVYLRQLIEKEMQ